MGITGRFRLITGALAAVLCAHANADNVVALGPVEKISLDGGVVQVLGQTFTLRAPRSVDAPSRLVLGSADLELGTYLYIEGARSPDGKLLASRVEVCDTRYVPGSSEVLLAGVVSSFDQTLGLATIGGTQIYIPDASVDVTNPISVGTSLTVLGYQADPRQRIWATEIGSNDLTSIQGTRAENLSIQGTGVNSLSIQGTGKQSVQETPANALSIQGTGANALSIQGTGKQSIQGTGRASIQGTGKQSIQGTGASALSIQGTGVNSLSIQGTGRLSIQGTGVNSLSIQGTG